jgi:hypothetical protein
VLQGSRLEHLDSRQTSDDSPCTQNQDLPNRLVKVRGQRKLIDLLASLKDPDALRFALLRSTPCCENLFLPGESRGDVGGGLRPSDEDEVQPATKIVSLDGSANRGRNLESRLAERDRSERDARR